MKVILSPKYYGYCPGLKRSLKIADELIKESKSSGRKIYYDVPLAHNTEVAKELEENGFNKVDVTGTRDAESDYFLVSAHGASSAKIAQLKQKNFDVRSATCPTVRKLQDIALADYRVGYKIIIFGKANHAETEGVNGCIEDSALIVHTLDEGRAIKLDQKASILCQTTFSLAEFKKLVKIIKKNNPKIEVIVRATACPVVEHRIKGAQEFARETKPDLVVVVGSKTSSNTKLLASEIAKEARTIMIDSADELTAAELTGVETVLVMSGTSAPPEVVEKVAKALGSL